MNSGPDKTRTIENPLGKSQIQNVATHHTTHFGELLERWESLPDHVRKAIETLLNASK